MREAAHIPIVPTPILPLRGRAGVGKNSFPTPLPFCLPRSKLTLCYWGPPAEFGRGGKLKTKNQAEEENEEKNVCPTPPVRA